VKIIEKVRLKMAKNLDNYLADRVLTRQLYLLRFTAGEQKKVLAVLVDMRAELVAKLRAGDVTDFTRGRLKTLLKQFVLKPIMGGISS